MLIVLSPAKRLDFTEADPALPGTDRRFLEDTASLATTARRQTKADLRRLMSISDDLATLNLERFKAFDSDSTDGVQAAFAFAGDVYEGLKARELDAPALDFAQAHLRILSGFYGLLRPLDRIQPYRLEMGTRLKTRRGSSLYDFWGDRISKQLNADAEG
ncbi:MAG: YaaA family protein, partial [Brevundimonas sp.]